MSQPENQAPAALNEWNTKLVGKRIVKDDTQKDREGIFVESDLPQPSRVLPPGAITTRDYRENRLNVHVDESGVVQQVNFG